MTSKLSINLGQNEEKWNDDGKINRERIVKKRAIKKDDGREEEWQKNRKDSIYKNPKVKPAAPVRSSLCGAYASRENTGWSNVYMYQYDFEQVIFYPAGENDFGTQPFIEDIYKTTVIAVILGHSLMQPGKEIDCFSTADKSEITRVTEHVAQKRITPLVTVQTKSNNLYDGVLRIYIPCSWISPKYEPRIRCACCADFIKTLPLTTFQEISDGMFLGFEPKQINCMKFYAVAEEKRNKILYKGEKVEAPLIHKNSKIVIHKGAFTSTAVSYLDKAKQLHRKVKNVSSVLCCVTVERPEEHDLNIDIEIPIEKEVSCVKIVSRVKGEWTPTAAKKNKEKYIFTLPKQEQQRRQDDIIAFATNTNINDQETSQAAERIVQVCNEDIASLIIAQKCNNPRMVNIQCVDRELVTETLERVQKMGFEVAGQSEEFPIADGETIQIHVKGNIRYTSEDEQANPSPICYCKHVRSSKTTFYVAPSKIYQHIQEGEGFLTWEIPDNECTERNGKIPIFLQNVPLTSEMSWDDVGISKYIAKLVTDDKERNWQHTFEWLLPYPPYIEKIPEMLSLPDSEKTGEIKEFIQTSMKAFDKSEKKRLLLKYFAETGNMKTAECIKDFWDIYIALFSDISISKMSTLIGMEYKNLGINLGMTYVEIQKIENDHKQTNDVILDMLSRVRTNDTVINNGKRLKAFLLEICNEVKTSPELLQYIEAINPS